MMHVCDRRQGWQLGLAGFLAVGWVYSCSGDRATAQITPDATLGRESSVVTPNVNVRSLPADLIEGGAARGANLFHSFDQFNVGKGQRVYFANPAGIENILGRVTGNNLSEILGTLGVNGGANLFLLNPNGIIFGPNAKLDIAGSFVATTAKSLVFGNGFEFSANNPQAPPLLTINITPGLQYGSNQPRATITNAAHLEVGQNLTLSADTLDLQGQLSAGGDLTLKATDTLRVRDSIVSPFMASAGGQLVVQGDRNVDIFALNHPASIFSSGGNMVWRSANTVGGDARVMAGGNFRVEQLDGNLGNLSSPHDPVFEVRGDFSLASYAGASLQILAGGSVNIPGNVTINGVGGAFNDNSVTLSDGTTLALSGTTRPTLDIRAGTTKFFGTPRRGTPTSADITIGRIILNAPDGVVFLTNQYEPNLSLAGGAITVGYIHTGSNGGYFVGNGGSVIIDSRNGLTVIEAIDSSSITSGNAGDITLMARQLLVQDGGEIDSNSYSSGDGGKLMLDATESVQLIGTVLQTGSGGTGKAGDLTINTSQLLLQNGTWVSTDNFGSGDGGNLTINATKSVQLFGVATSSYRGSNGLSTIGGRQGKGGDLTINTSQLLFQDRADIMTGSNGSGDGGNLTINATQSVHLVGGSLQTDTNNSIDGTGKAGDLTINTSQLLLQDGAAISTRSFGGLGNGGKLTINATQSVQLVDSRLYSDTRGTREAGDVTISTSQLLLQDGARIESGTEGAGDGGQLMLNATKSVQLVGTSTYDHQPSRIETNTTGAGKAGDVTINTTQLLVQDGASISATTSGAGQAGTLKVNADYVGVIGTSADSQRPSRLSFDSFAAGNAGELTITTKNLVVRDGGQISAATSDLGLGGILDVKASDSVEVSGTSANGQYASGLYFDSRGDGNAKGIRINTGRLVVENGGQVTVSGTGSGISGDLEVTADSISLSNRGSLRATTAASEGGNIRLKVADSITLRDNSEIVAEAFGTANGGNITIDAGSFVRAILSENSDIVANAFQGRGGIISAKAAGIFGFRQFIDRRTPESDFTANSVLGINGVVELNTRDKLEEPLPANFVDTTQLIDRRCTSRDRTQERNSFTITGRGGLPPSPNDPLQGEAVVTHWVSLDSDVETNIPPATTTPSTSAPKQLVEAQGWVINEKGQVVLTASAPTVTPKGEWLPKANCNPPSAQGQ